MIHRHQRIAMYAQELAGELLFQILERIGYQQLPPSGYSRHVFLVGDEAANIRYRLRRDTPVGVTADSGTGAVTPTQTCHLHSIHPARARQGLHQFGFAHGLQKVCHGLVLHRL